MIVPDGVLRVWLKKYKPSDAVTVTSIQDLQDTYGDVVKDLVTDHGSPYKLAKALRTTQAPPIIISMSMAGQWIKTFGKLHNSQRMFASNGALIPHVKGVRTHVKGVRTYFGILD